MRISLSLVLIAATITFASLTAITAEEIHPYDCQKGDRYRQQKIIRMMLRRLPPALARMTSTQIDKEVAYIIRGKYDDMYLPLETEEEVTIDCGYGNSLKNCCMTICDWWEKNGHFFDGDAVRECKKGCTSGKYDVQCPSGKALGDDCVQDNYSAFIGMIASDVNRRIRDLIMSGDVPKSAEEFLEKAKVKPIPEDMLMGAQFGLMPRAAAPLPKGGKSEKVIKNQCRRWCDLHRKVKLPDSGNDLDLINKAANIILKQKFMGGCYKQCGSPPDFWSECASMEEGEE